MIEAVSRTFYWPKNGTKKCARAPETKKVEAPKKFDNKSAGALDAFGQNLFSGFGGVRKASARSGFCEARTPLSARAKMCARQHARARDPKKRERGLLSKNLATENSYPTADASRRPGMISLGEGPIGFLDPEIFAKHRF